MFRKISFLGVIFSILTIASGASANTPTKIGDYSDWSAYSFMENGKKVCYMISSPKTKEGNYTRRGEDVYTLVTHRPSENTRNVFSYITGYPYKQDSEVSVSIDGRKFTLFTYEETAWAPDSATDNALATALRQGSKMVVKGTSKRGTLTTDTYSLKGSGAAHDAISKACPQ
ncbi:MAG: invasion associated locus B family protein [Bdellovibrionales bacterium]